MKSKYIDIILCFSRKEIEYYSKTFKVGKEKFDFCHLGVDKINVKKNVNIKEKTILSCGRSNRDYEFLYNALKNTDYKLNIISDECKLPNCENITIYKNIYNQNFFEMLNECYAVVIPLENKNISSGQLVCLQSMQLGKPVICTESETIKDYIKDGETGFIIEKDDKKLLESLEKLFENKKLDNEVSHKEKEFFEKNYSIEALGQQIGKIYNKYKGEIS